MALVVRSLSRWSIFRNGSKRDDRRLRYLLLIKIAINLCLLVRPVAQEFVLAVLLLFVHFLEFPVVDIACAVVVRVF